MFLPGLALFYSGLLSRKNVLSTIMQSTGSLIVVSIVWVLWGHTLTFGTDQFGIIGGLDFLFFEGVGMDPFSTLTFPHLIFAIFQALFAAITVALISGAVARESNFPYGSSSPSSGLPSFIRPSRIGFGEADGYSN